jgi:hypothetical protein
VSAESIVSQRRLTGLNVVLRDARWYAKYAFPFFTAQWRVPFVAFDILGQPPRIWENKVAVAGHEIRIDAAAKDVTPATSVDVRRFEGLLHFDPWWAFKGAGFPDALVRAVVPTNVAGRLHALDRPRRVVDLAFDHEILSLVAVQAEDEHFDRRTFLEGGLDLAKLRPTSS